MKLLLTSLVFSLVSFAASANYIAYNNAGACVEANDNDFGVVTEPAQCCVDPSLLGISNGGQCGFAPNGYIVTALPMECCTLPHY